MLSRKPIQLSSVLPASALCEKRIADYADFLAQSRGEREREEQDLLNIYPQNILILMHCQAVYSIYYTIYNVQYTWKQHFMFAIYRVCFFFLTCFPFSSTCKNLSCGFYMHGMVIGNGKSLLSLLSRVQIRIRLSGFTISLQYDIRTKISGHRDGGEISPSWCI